MLLGGLALVWLPAIGLAVLFPDGGIGASAIWVVACAAGWALGIYTGIDMQVNAERSRREGETLDP